MALYTQLASSAINTTDTSVNVPAGEVWMVHSITLQQPAAGLAKNILIALNGTSLTAANVRQTIVFAAGIQNQVIYPGFGLPAGTTINYSASADANVATITINGFKQKTV